MKTFKIITETTLAETLILANGEFPTHPIPLSILDNREYLICCDGAINELSKTTTIPDAIVGDCDSMSSENKVRFQTILHPDKDQETNDLTKSIHFSIKQNKKDIIIIGATGKREDHTIANISLLAEHMHLANLRIVTDYGTFTAIDSDSTFESYKGQQVSIFSIDNSPLSVTNLKYPIENRAFTNWWQGTLNESLGNDFTVKTEKRLIIYQTF